MGLFEGGGNYFHYPLDSLVSGQITGRENRPTYDRKLDENFADHAPPIRTRPLNVQSMNQGKQKMARVNMDILGIREIK